MYPYAITTGQGKETVSTELLRTTIPSHLQLYSRYTRSKSIQYLFTMDKISQIWSQSSTALSIQALPVSQLHTPLAILGGAWASFHLYKLASFTWLHFLRPSRIRRYVSNGPEQPWALVTGASDGLGKGFVAELASCGFNVVLHGRNEKKLEGVKQDIQQQFPQRKFRLLILDAGSDAATMESRVSELKGLNLKVLINNVAGGAPQDKLFRSFQEVPAPIVDAILDQSARFAAQITRLLLPQLSKQQPALIINIGSGVSEFATPYLVTYSGAKAFNMAWSRSLGLEMKGQGLDIEVLGILLGGVATERSRRSASLTQPSPRRMAKACLDVVGCGRAVVYAYWFHAIQGLMIDYLPTFVVEKAILGMARGMMAKQERGEVAL